MPTSSPWLLAFGTVATLVAGSAAFRQEGATAHRQFEELAQERLQVAERELQRSALAAELLVAFHGASDRVEVDELAGFCAPLLAGDAGVRWVAWRADAAAATTIVPSRCADEANRLLGGATFPQKRATRLVAADAPQPLLLLLQRRTRVGERSADGLSGELTVAIDPTAQLERALRKRPSAPIDLALLPEGATEPAVWIGVEGLPPPASRSGWPQAAATGERLDLRLDDLAVQLLATAPNGVVHGGHPYAIGIWSTGMLLTLAVCWALGHGKRTRSRIEQLVVERTRQLAEANALLERRVAERTHELAAANREMEAFNYSVSHDLRAPLRAIDGFAGMLAEDHGERLDADAHRLLGIIRASCADLGRLIDALLRLSRTGRQALAPVLVDLDALVAETVEELQAHGEAAATRFDVGPLGTVHADPVLLREVVRNLLGNAVKFSRGSAGPRVTVTRADDPGGCSLTVADNGVGFDPAYADKLFAPFQRLHRSDEFEGTGIGLALCQRIVARHGGRITATAIPGAGATFRVHLPVSTRATEEIA